MEDAEAAALAVLSKRSFDRTPEEVQQLAAWLVATCQPFFSSMRPDVVQHLCAHVGHAWVDEAQPIYTQGQIGDRMFIIVKGYCSVLKHAEAASTSAATNMADNSSGSSSVTPSSRRGTGSSQTVSRRATVEMQTQQFALATGAVGLSTGLSSRRGTAEAVGSGAGGTARRVSGAVVAQQVGSRRVTAEQVVQQRLAESAQLGWLSRGDSFGEAALVNPSQQRPVSVVAGDEGVMLLVLDRACFSRLQQQAQEGQPLAVAAVQAVLAAACRPLLRVGGRGRTVEEVQTLAELFSGLEAFKCIMPPAVRTRLAKACQGLQLPPGALVFEEDDKGDAMYVVVAGCLQVRARPLNTDPNLAAAAAGPQPQQQQEGQPAAAAGPGGAQEASAFGGAQSCGGSGVQRKQRATTDATCAGPERSHWGVGGAGGVGASLAQGGSRRTTWEGVASTAKEQARLDQVRSLLETERLQEGMLLLPGGSAAARVTDKGDRQAGGSLVERDGLYWTAKFMSDAAAAATSSDPQWGLEGGMTPLAAVFASKWRQQVRQQAAVHHAQTAAAEEEAADSKAYAAMEEMLGKAAAKAWKAARDNAAALASAATAGSGSSNSSSAAGSGSCKESLTVAGAIRGGDAAAQGAGRVGCGDDAVAAATVVAGDSIDSETFDPDSPTAVAPEGAPDAGASPADADVPAGAAAEPAAPCSPRTAAAAAAQLLAAAAAASDPVEAVKLHLAALGVKDPADVSRTLMAEIGARSNLEGLLQAVAGFLEKKGLPRRLNKKSSLKITRELNKRMLAGASWKGYSGAGSSSSQGSSFNEAMRRSRQQQQAAGAWGDAASASAAAAAGGSEGDLLGAEATGLSSCDWQSSMVLDGGSDGVISMYGVGGMGPEDSMEGSPVGNSFELAASTGTSTGVGPVPAGVHWQQQQQQGHVAAGAGGEGAALTAGLGGSCSCGCGCHQRQQGTSVEGGVGDAALAGSLAGGCCQCCCVRTGEQRRQLQVPGAKGAVGAAGGSGSAGCLTARFGPVIRTLGTGDSFGELALLQCRAVRTATVVVEPDQTDETGGSGGGGGAGSSGGGSGALLIKISRACYDATVRALQVSALEELLGFLASLPVFRGLSREVLTSLAVFMRPVDAQPGQVLALGGQAADALLIIQAGEVKLLAPTGGRTPSGSSGGGSNGSNGSSGSTDGSTSLACSGGRGSSRQLGRQASNPAGVTGAGGSSSNSSSNSGGAGTQALLGLSRLPPQQQQQQQQLSGLQLAVLGPGSLLGENLLGYNAEEDPVAAVAVAPSRRARQAAAAAAAGLTHHATAVVSGGAPARLLVVSADDLRRFGRRVRGPLAEAAAVRREWLAARLAAVQVSHAPQGFRAAPVLAAVEKRESFGRRTPAGSASPPVHASGTEANRGSAALVSAGPRQGSQGAAPAGNNSSSSSNSSTSVAGLWPGLASLLRDQGSSMAAKVHGSSSSLPAAAAAASRARWQQQQWQRDAYGELLQQQSPASSTQQQQQQQLCVGDVARLRQLVPGSGPPCVSELAAAARPFPAGLLTASAVAAAGRDGAKGLRQLLQLVPATDAAATAAAAGSPKWSVGAVGRVLPAGGGVEGPGPVSGRRAPMARHMECDSEQ